MEEPKPVQTTPSPTQIPDPNTAQNLPPQPPPPTEEPQPPQTTPPTQNPDPNPPNTSQNLPPQPPLNPNPPNTTQNPPPQPPLNPNPPNTTQNPPPQPASSMEESEPAQTTPPPSQTPIPNPPNTAQNLPPPHPHSLPQKNNKRPLDQNGHIQNSKYFKMRAVLKELRPHFIEVLRTPVFHNCKAAHEIGEQMKHLMDLYKEMTAETISIEKSKNMSEGPLSSEIQYGQKPREHHQYAKPAEQPSAPVLLGTISDKQTQGTYIVGGSAFGWNFVTYPGSKSVYYGRTKEMFRSANVIPEEAPILT